MFVKLGVVLRDFSCWKTWEQGGVPELAVEITSRSDRPDRPWSEKLEAYGELGVIELVRFDALAATYEALRVWDRVDDNLLERVGARAEWSEALGLWWVVLPDPSLGRVLRLARDPVGQDLLLTPEERDARAREAAERARDAAEHAREDATRAREAAEHARDDERRARETAEQRVRELEAELGRRGGC